MIAVRGAVVLVAGALNSAGLGLTPIASALSAQETMIADAGAVRQEVQVDSLARTFLVHVPPEPAWPPPLVLAFHGGGGDGARMRDMVGRNLEPLADERGFLVAYPDGYEGHWNDCRGRALFPAKQLAIDDIAFVRALVQRLVHEHNVDPTRVFALGFSNGGHMAYRLALEVPGDVAAVVAFAATLPVEQELDCRPSGRPVPVLAVLGTDDPLSPYEGGEMVSPEMASRGHARSGPQSLEYFSRLAGYAGAPVRTEVVAAEPSETLRVERSGWCQPGSPEVALFTVYGGGHVIPGPYCQAPAVAGPCERRFDGVSEAVRFFFAQPHTRSDERSSESAKGLRP